MIRLSLRQSIRNKFNIYFENVLLFNNMRESSIFTVPVIRTIKRTELLSSRHRILKKFLLPTSLNDLARQISSFRKHL